MAPNSALPAHTEPCLGALEGTAGRDGCGVVLRVFCRRRRRPALPVAAEQPDERDRGRASIVTVSRTLDSGFGFSNGCALLMLNAPPPSPDSSLMGSQEAHPSTQDRLLRTRQRGQRAWAVEVLHHAARHEHVREHDSQRQEDA